MMVAPLRPADVGMEPKMRAPTWVLAVAGSAAVLVLAGAILVAYADGVLEQPTDDRLLTEFREHQSSFEALRETAAKDPSLGTCGLGSWGWGGWCSGNHQETYRGLLAQSGGNLLSRDYDGTIRVGFAGGGLLAIGPGWEKGIEYIPGSPARDGELVASTDGANRLPADVYLRPILPGWYIFYQRDDG
ncbi:MAG: hypothetical protein ACREEB_11575 [Caulobacteraceae bacterium]